jgi:hypothetical protein
LAALPQTFSPFFMGSWVMQCRFDAVFVGIIFFIDNWVMMRAIMFGST